MTTKVKMADSTSSAKIGLADPVLVEPAHALGVDQDRADLHADEERRRHAATALVEELDHGAVGADGHDQFGALLEGQQHRDVLARARGREHDVREPELVEALGTGRARPCSRGPPGAAPQCRAVGHGVHVADDHVGGAAELEEGVGAAVDPDQQRPHLRQVAGALQRGRGPPGSRRPARRQHVAIPEVEATGQVGLSISRCRSGEVRERVLGEALQLVAHEAPRFLDLVLQEAMDWRVREPTAAAGDDLVAATMTAVPRPSRTGPRARRVDEGDAGGESSSGPRLG